MNSWIRAVPAAALLLFGMQSLVSGGSSSGPIDVGSERQLFVDRFLISEMDGASLKLHPPTPREVVLTMDRPWEGTNSWTAVVLKDGGRYRLWYRSIPSRDTGHREEYTAYAESQDGIHWTKPTLGIIEFDGSKANNLVWYKPGSNMSVFKDEKPGVPSSERYKAVTRSRGAYGLVSPDGIHWKLVQEEPILKGGQFDSHNIVFQDPWTLEYRYYGRGFLHRELRVLFDREKHERGSGIRRVRYATSSDFRNWSPLEFIDMGQEPLDHLYTNATVPYTRAKGIYVMFPKRFVPERTFKRDWPNPGQSDIVFASSRDGVRWDRTFLEAFVRPGPDLGNWHDRSIAMGQGIVETGPREFSMYYFENFHLDSCRIRRCTIRPDGFVSVNAPFAGGRFTTRPLIFKGKSLWINYSTSAVGFVKVEILNASGEAIPGFSLEESEEMFGDELERRVAWKSGSDLSRLQGQTVVLRIVMKDADLYSLRFGDN